MSSPKIGMFLPMFGGLIAGAQTDPDPEFSYLKKSALLAEEVGLHSIWCTDHLLNPKFGENAPALESWTVISALAAVTGKIKLGNAVLCQAMRYPAVLAKMVATLDDICQGRFVFALGGGNFEREFKAYGLDWDDHDKLIERGREQLQIVKRLWTEDEVSFEGTYYQLERCIVEPKPVQKPHPPIFWGGSSLKSQEVAAELADGWFMKDGTPDEAKANVSSMQSLLKGRNIEIGIGCHFLIGDTDAKAREKLLGFVHGNQSLTDEIIQQGIVGSPETIIGRIKEYVAAGMDYILLKPSPTLEGIEEFGEKVVPLLRDEGLI